MLRTIRIAWIGMMGLLGLSVIVSASTSLSPTTPFADSFCSTLQLSDNPLLDTIFIDPYNKSILTNASSSAECLNNCCSIGGCISFSYSSVDSKCFLFQNVAKYLPLPGYTSQFVMLRANPSNSTRGPIVLHNTVMNEATQLLNSTSWSVPNAIDCIKECELLAGCLAILAVNQSSSIECYAQSSFLGLSVDGSNTSSVILFDRSLPQFTPLDFNYSTYTPVSPIRGWNTYDGYGSVPTEAEILDNAAFLSKYLLTSGYRLVSLDWGWWESLSGQTTLDERGRFQPAPDRFPSAKPGIGFTALAKQVHDMGLLFGIYTDAGISIYFNNTGKYHVPVTQQCVWQGNSWFLDWRDPLAQSWLDSVVEQWAQWGVDYVKVDCIGSITGVEQVFMYTTAIARSSNPNIMLGISPGYNGDVASERVIANYVHEYRIAVDFHDYWDVGYSFYPAFTDMIPYASQLESLYPGLPLIRIGSGKANSYPDFDALPFGYIYSMSQNNSLTWSAFNTTQQQCIFAAWCIYRSPLIYGGRLVEEHIDWQSIEIITNPSLLHIHTMATNTRTLFYNHTYAVIVAERKEIGEYYLAVININSTVPISATFYTPSSMACQVSEAWSGKVLYGVRSFDSTLQYSISQVFTVGNCTSSARIKSSRKYMKTNQKEIESSSITFDWKY